MTVPEIDLTDPEVLRDPIAAYGRARERGPVARLLVPGFPMWVITRYEEGRALLADPRFQLTTASYQRPDVPEHCRPYLRTMQELEGPEHTRLRRLVAPAFTARRAAEFRPRVEAIVADLLAALPESGPVDLLREFARPLPMAVICELVGVPEADRPAWREHGAAVAAGNGPAFAQAIPAIIDGARSVVAAHQDQSGLPAHQDQPGPAAGQDHPGSPADQGRSGVAGLVTGLLRRQAEDGDLLADTELVTLVWQLVLAGQVPTNLIANALAVLFAHPDQLAALRADPTLLPGAVEELIRWCGPQLLTVPRHPSEDVVIDGVRIPRGEPVTVAVAAANRDPRAFDRPDELDVRRAPRAGHLGFAHGPHFCLGAPLARVETEVALAAVLRRFPDLAPAGDTTPLPDPATWRLAALPVTW